MNGNSRNKITLNNKLRKLNKLMPDIIILDLEMPEMNGIEFLKQRNKIGLKTPVIILSAQAVKGASITLDALSLGASDFILKPSTSADSIEKTKKQLIEMVLALAEPGSYSEMEISTEHEIDVKKEEHKVSEIPLLDVDVLLLPISCFAHVFQHLDQPEFFSRYRHCFVLFIAGSIVLPFSSLNLRSFVPSKLHRFINRLTAI